MCIVKQVSGSLFSLPGPSPLPSARHSDSSGSRAWNYPEWLVQIKWNVHPDVTDQCWESEREGRLPVGTGSSREAQRDCCVPLDSRGHSGCLGGAVRAALYLDLGAQCVSTPVPLGEYSELL